jgi:hypothetical protein
MAVDTKGSFTITASEVPEPTPGPTAAVTPAPGRVTKCMGRVSSTGRMDGTTPASTPPTRSMEKVRLFGAMGRSSEDYGSTGNNTGRVRFVNRTVLLSEVFGILASA